MTISLTAELEEFVNRELKSGKYQSAADVVVEGLRLLQEREARLAELRQEIGIGLEDVKQGKVAPFDPRATLAAVRADRTRQS